MNLLSCTAVQLVRLLEERKISAEELTRFYLERINQYDGPEGLNTVGEINEQVLAQARQADALPMTQRGVLKGLPILIKDNIDVCGMHTTAGSAALADNMAASDAVVITNLKCGGALILGKTNMTEFANFITEGMPNGFSSRGGQVKNAYDRKADAGGSSTGSAVAVSARLCAAAVGTDTSFSIVGCAGLNGVTGYKPPWCALPGKGILPISHTLDAVGPLAQDVADALLLYRAMGGTHLGEVKPVRPGDLRLAVNTYDRDQVSARQSAKYDAVIQAVLNDGARITEVCHPYTSLQSDIMCGDFRHDLEKYLAHSSAARRNLPDIIAYYEATPHHMPYGISALREVLDEMPGGQRYLAALGRRKILRREMAEALGGCDAVLMTGVTNAMHFVGFPSIALKLGISDNGHPLGMILYGADERRLLSAALTLERYCEPVRTPDLS